MSAPRSANIDIIDGCNGLASIVTICMRLSLADLAWQGGDVFEPSSARMVAGITLGFLIWNYRIVLIFLRDAVLSVSCPGN